MTKFIINATNRLCLRNSLVGNKAVKLARLLRAGYPVPRFFVVTTHLFERCLRNSLHARVKEKRKLWAEDRQTAESFFASMKLGCPEMPTRFWRRLEQHLGSLRTPGSEPEPVVAVRSSSPLEDHAHYSFAGQFLSVTGVHGIDAVWEAIKRAWLSLWETNVRMYLKSLDGTQADISMAVIVQKMVRPTVSGVLFTQDPVGGDETTMLVEATAHSPDGVESGKAEPSRYYIDKKMLTSLSTRTVQGASDQTASAAQTLNQQQLQELARAGKNIESYFGCAQDIEWAFEETDLWILQARPMTTTVPNERQRRDENGILWTDYFFVERFIDPVTPLGWSITGKWIKKRAFREPLYYLGFDDLCRHPLLTRLFDFFPFTRNEVFESLYAAIPESAISNDKRRAFLPEGKRTKWWKESIRCLPYVTVRLLFRDVNWVPQLHLRAWQRFLARYRQKLEANKKPLDVMAQDDLRAWFLQVEALTDELLSYHRWSITFADLFFYLLKRLVQSWVREPRSSLATELVSGIPGNKTVEAKIKLAQLAAGLSDKSEFNKRFEQFLATHGHRSRNLDPYYPTWRDDPSFLQKVLTEISSDHNVREKVVANEQRATEKRKQAELFVVSHIKGPTAITRKVFEAVLEMAQSFALLRENQRYYWHMALAETRRIILEVGSRLVERELLDHPGQVFFLTRSEFLRCLSHDTTVGDLRNAAQSRHEKWKQAQVKARSEPEHEIRGDRAAKLLRGIGVSAGEVQARASVVTSLEEAQAIAPGSILVARSIDPAWTPVLAKAAGLVLEVGGVLSHPAIVAREFQLPAVTSVARASSLIADGQVVHIDGSQGIVRIITN